MLLRRLRGLGVAMLVGATTWGLLGLALGLAIVAAARLGVLDGVAIGTSPSIPGGLPGATTLIGVVIGAINGLALGLLLLAGERGHAVDRIPWWRFGLWGAAATGAAAWVTFNEPLIVAVCGVLGGAASLAALALAKRPAAAASADAGSTQPSTPT